MTPDPVAPQNETAVPSAIDAADEPSPPAATGLGGLRESLSLKRRFNAEVVWNLASVGILGVSGILMNGVIARWRGAEALGIFNQVFAIYIMLSQIAVGGVHLSVLRCLSYHQDDRAKCGEIASAGLLLGFGLSTVVSACAYLLSGSFGAVLGSPAVATGVVLAAPGLVFFSLNKILLNALNGLRCMRAFAVLQALRFIFLLISVVAILASGRPSHDIALALTTSELALFVITATYVRVRAVHLFIASPASPWIAEHLSFGMRGFFAGLLSEMNTRVDVLMLGYFTSDAAVGVYSFAAILAEGFCQIPLVVRRNLDPIIGRAFSENNRERIREAARRVKKIMYVLMAAIALAAVGGFPILLWLLGAEAGLGPSWAVFVILMAGIWINSGYRPFLGIFLQGGRPGAYTLIVFTAVAGNVLLNLLLIPPLGIYGAAAATSIMFVGEAVLIVLFARRLFAVAL